MGKRESNLGSLAVLYYIEIYRISGSLQFGVQGCLVLYQDWSYSGVEYRVVIVIKGKKKEQV